MITALVLAAGASTRMGHPKQLLDLGGRPALQHVVDVALTAAVEEVVVVLGHAAHDVAAAVPARGRVRFAVNPEYRAGQSTSLRTGLRAMDARTEAAVILLGDQPGVRLDALSAVISAWRDAADDRHPIVQASYQGRPAHPTLLARSVWADAEAIVGDEGARALIARHPEWRALVEVGGDPPEDLDTPEDYERLRNRFSDG